MTPASAGAAGERAEALLAAIATLAGVTVAAELPGVLAPVLREFREYFDLEGVRLSAPSVELTVGFVAAAPDRRLVEGAGEAGGAGNSEGLLLDITTSSREHARLDALGSALLATVAATVRYLDVEAQLLDIARYDDLTGLLNRRSLLATIQQRLAPGASGPVALLRCDIDRMAALNHVLGAEAGDTYLRVTGRRLRETARAQLGDVVVARLGADEFAVLGAPMDAAAAQLLADRLHQVLARPVGVTPGAEPVEPVLWESAGIVRNTGIMRTVSIGIGIGEPGVTSADGLLRYAAEAAAVARGTGGRTVLHDEQMRRREAVRAEVELRLPDALTGGQLAVFYQAEVDLATSRVVGAEALMRWNHPSLGLLLPDTFLAIVDASAYAVSFGSWVLDEACRQWAEWVNRFDSPGVPPRRVRVNVTSTQLMSADFVDIVAACLARHELPAAALHLEITEHDVVRDVDAARRTLSGLAELGVGLAIDDFGTGYSSFTQLKQFAVDTLKIDRSFVTGIVTDVDDRAIVRAIIWLAGALGMEVVAEGVQDQAAVEILLELGCRRAQGFLFAQPLPAAEFELLLGSEHPIPH